MPEQGGDGGGSAFCFEWGGEKWGKDYAGWTVFRQWLVDHGADPNAWIDAHPSAAACIGATKTPPPQGPPPSPPPQPPPQSYCFTWFDQGWGKDGPGWASFYDALVAHGDDPAAWITAHPDAAKCIGATAKSYCFEWDKRFWGKDYPGWDKFEAWLTSHGANVQQWIDAHPSAAACIGAPPPTTPQPPSPPPPPPPTPSPPGPQSTPTGASWNLDNGPWLFVESDPGTFRDGPWTRLDITPDAIESGAPLWSCDGGLVPQAEGDQEQACRDWITANWNRSDAIAPVTTLGISSSAFAELGVTSCMVECYLQAQANALDKVGEAIREGWKDAIPVVGVGFDAGLGVRRLQDYATFLQQFGTRFAVYATDPMDDDDWNLLAQLVAGAPPAGGSGGSSGGEAGGGATEDFVGDETDKSKPIPLANPFEKGATFERNDQGIDRRGPPGGHVLAVGNGKIYAHHPNPTAGPGFGESLYYKLDSYPVQIYIGHCSAIVKSGKVTAGEKIAQLRKVPYGNAGGDPWHTEVGFATGAAPAYGLAQGSLGGEEFQTWLTQHHIPNPGDRANIGKLPPSGQQPPPTGPPSPGVPPPTKPVPPLPTSKFKEPPATVAAWTALKEVFSRKAPSTRSSATAIIDNPPSFLK